MGMQVKKIPSNLGYSYIKVSFEFDNSDMMLLNDLNISWCL